MDLIEKIIKQDYNGDKAAYLKAHRQYFDTERRETLFWKDVELGALIFPEHEEFGKRAIEVFLGYLPERGITLPYEPILRTIINQFETGQITDDNYLELVEEHIKLIRNDDLDVHSDGDYEQEAIDQYHSEYPNFGELARNRLISFIGYAPELQHSLLAELYMREIMSFNDDPLPAELTIYDHRAVAIIKYREVLLEYGKVAANASPLWAMRMNDFHSKK
jgi:hypothetical protein